MTTPATEEPAAIGDVLAHLASFANQTDDDGNPIPIAAGTFAFYATPEGGVMIVTDCPDGPFEGLHRHHLRPGMIRAIGGLASGGPLGALKALRGKKNGR